MDLEKINERLSASEWEIHKDRTEGKISLVVNPSCFNGLGLWENLDKKIITTYGFPIISEEPAVRVGAIDIKESGLENIFNQRNIGYDGDFSLEAFYVDRFRLNKFDSSLNQVVYGFNGYLVQIKKVGFGRYEENKIKGTFEILEEGIELDEVLCKANIGFPFLNYLITSKVRLEEKNNLTDGNPKSFGVAEESYIRDYVNLPENYNLTRLLIAQAQLRKRKGLEYLVVTGDAEFYTWYDDGLRDGFKSFKDMPLYIPSKYSSNTAVSSEALIDKDYLSSKISERSRYHRFQFLFAAGVASAIGFVVLDATVLKKYIGTPQPVITSTADSSNPLTSNTQQYLSQQRQAPNTVDFKPVNLGEFIYIRTEDKTDVFRYNIKSGGLIAVGQKFNRTDNKFGNNYADLKFDSKLGYNPNIVDKNNEPISEPKADTDIYIRAVRNR